jgi:type IV secretion system protein TrbL
VRERIYKSLRRWLPVIACAGLSVPLVFAQVGPDFNTTVPTQVMDQFRDERLQWTANVFSYANALFGILAVIEFAWSAAVMLLEKSDLQTWTSALIRKLMWIGAFYALLLNGRVWIPAIIDSFTQIGQNAAGLNALSPSNIFMQGLSLAGALMDGASTSAFFTNPGTSLALAFAALLIVVSYTLIAINFIVTLVESYLVVSVGFIFLGFGGSRWTAPYTERYIGLAVSIGIKIVLLYCLIAAGFDLSIGWLNEAQGISTSARPAMTAFDVMGGALIFMMCCWQIPKLFAAVIGGSPALTGGDFVATAAIVGGAALAVGGAAVTGVGSLIGGGGAAAGAGTAAGAGGGAGSSTKTAVASVGLLGSSAGGDSVCPPSSSSAAESNGSFVRPQPDPPSSPSSSMLSTLASIGGEPLEGSGFEGQSVHRGFAGTSVAAASETSAPGAGSLPSATVENATTGAGETSAGSATTGNTGSASEIASVRAANSANPSLLSRTIRGNPLTRAVDQVRGLRRRLRSLPSDAAPHATPPRMPIEHEE